MSQGKYTYKMVQKIAKRSTENTLYIVLAVLVDKHKFGEEKITQFMKDVAFGSRSLGEYVNRQDLKDIIEKHTGLDV